MIHHLSIPARDPGHVAEVLAELMQGYCGPFVGPVPGAYVAYADDSHGSGIEVYPEDVVLLRDDGAGPVGGRKLPEGLPRHAFHALVSVPVQRGEPC